jgi:hypothetical protein
VHLLRIEIGQLFKVGGTSSPRASISSSFYARGKEEKKEE